jgi:hypothetical protein
MTPFTTWIRAVRQGRGRGRGNFELFSSTVSCTGGRGDYPGA